MCCDDFSDFGLAKILKQGHTAKKSVGSRRWMAPEVQAGKEYTELADSTHSTPLFSYFGTDRIS